MNLFAIPNLIAGIFCFFVGTFVLMKNTRSPIGLSFFILTTSASIWQVGTFAVLISLSPEAAYRWCKFTYWGAIFIPVATYHFVVSFLKKSEQTKFVLLSYLIGALVFLPLSQTKFFLSGVYRYFWGYWFKAGFLHPVFLLFFALLMLASFVNLHSSYKKENLPLKKMRIKFLFFGFLIAYLGSVDFPSDYGIAVYPFGYLPLIAYLSIIAYAIVKFRLMDINVAITRTGIFIAVYTLVLGLPFVLMTLGKNWLTGFLGGRWWFGPLLLMVALAIAGPFIYIFLQKRAEAILLREQRRYQEALKQAVMGMTRIRNLKNLLDFIAQVVTETVCISHSAIYLSDQKTGQLLLKAGCNLKKEQPVSVGKESPLAAYLGEHRELLVYEEIKRKLEEGQERNLGILEEQMRNLSATVVVPSFLEDKLLSLLILGDKASAKIYTSEDLHNFSLLASEAALAIENASLYGNIEEEVRQRTKELVEIQKQLIHAEKLATVGTLAGGVAHEINNPLTAILTNVQMLLASGSNGNPEDKESLKLIEEATKRCRTIVQKLMAYAKKPLEPAEVSVVDISKVMQNVIAFLGYQLEQENIKIVNRTEEDEYLVLGNQSELEQVVTNIVLNAKDAIKQIKKAGEIHISISKNAKRINIIFKDEGAGMPKEILSKIFDPFFTTKEVGKGTGLGLSICQSIIEKHGGSITVESEVNQGSVFTIQLPEAKVSSLAKSK